MVDQKLYEDIKACIAEGDAEQAGRLAQRGLDAGTNPLELIKGGFTPALQTVGARWETGEIFLPEMILAAEAMKSAMRVLQPVLQKQSKQGEAVKCCVLGTVRGDIHDIGKSIVGALVEAAGFQVVDLGTDVEPSRFVNAVKESNARYLGMSALLTTTMTEMKTVLEALQAAGLRRQVCVAVGGAPVTKSFADEIGADGYAEDGLSAMHLFQKFLTRAAGEALGGRPQEG
ncbi:MAG: corrinoid protein [Acidobacteriota bacterium]